MYVIIMLLAFLLFTFNAVAQTNNIKISGFVFSMDSKAVLQASITLKKLNPNGEKQIVAFAFTKSNGEFLVSSVISDSITYFISASHIGYTIEEKKLVFLKTDTTLVFNFFLTPSKNQLKEIVIQDRQPVKIKKDTVEFTADSFRTAQTRKVEDLIKNIEGFKVEADGRITYRGKEVKALLLDGDDLTQDQYQLLTRNLNADMVDKLQVIDNYNKNRIMGGLLESNQAAINLKLKKGMHRKLNGSVSVAGSLQERYEGDATLVWLKSKFKMIGLLNANNIAKDATGLLRYQEFGSQGSLEQREEITKKLVNGAGIITTGTVAAPDISREYVLDNRNYFVSPLLHFRLTKSIKLAARTYAVNDLLSFNGSNNSSTFIDAQNQWSLQNYEASLRKRSNILTAVELIHDNQKKFAGNLNLQVGWINDRNSFTNQTTGFFTDTLNEVLKAERKGYAAAYNGAVKLNEYSVLNIQSNFNVLPELKSFEIKTNRLHLFYNLKDSFDLFKQTTNTDLFQWQNSISIYRKKAKTTLRFGYETNLQQLKIKNTVVGLDSLISRNERNVLFFENRISFLTNKQLTGKSSVRLTVNIGMATASNRSLASAPATHLVWKLTTGYTYKIRAFSGFNFIIGANRELPNILWFHPDNLVSANASIKNGAFKITPIEYYNAAISYSNFKLISKFSLLIGLNVRYGKTDYTGNSLLLPQYNINTWGIVHNNKQAGFNFDIGSFVFPLNSTFRVNANVNCNTNFQLLNNLEVQNKTIFGSFMATWIPNFKIPFGCEVNFSKSYFSNNQTNLNKVIKNNNQTTDFLIKVRSKFEGNYYIGSQYNYLKLSPVKEFHLWSLFQNYTFNKKMNADFVIHNVLNNQVFIQQMNSPNTVNENRFTGVGRYYLLRFNVSF